VSLLSILFPLLRSLYFCSCPPQSLQNEFPNFCHAWITKQGLTNESCEVRSILLLFLPKGVKGQVTQPKQTWHTHPQHGKQSAMTHHSRVEDVACSHMAKQEREERHASQIKHELQGHQRKKAISWSTFSVAACMALALSSHLLPQNTNSRVVRINHCRHAKVLAPRLTSSGRVFNSCVGRSR